MLERLTTVPCLPYCQVLLTAKMTGREYILVVVIVPAIQFLPPLLNVRHIMQNLPHTAQKCLCVCVTSFETAMSPLCQWHTFVTPTRQKRKEMAALNDTHHILEWNHWHVQWATLGLLSVMNERRHVDTVVVACGNSTESRLIPFASQSPANPPHLLLLN